MKSYNKSMLMGNLTADPELRQTKTGKSVVTFSLATNNEWFDNEGVLQKTSDFHRIVAWEGLADVCKKYLHKGSAIFLEGRLSNRSYEGSDKIKRFVTEVVATSLHLMPKGSKSGMEELAAT